MMVSPLSPGQSPKQSPHGAPVLSSHNGNNNINNTTSGGAPVPTEGPVHERKLFIGGLSHETDDRLLREFYEQWGDVIDCIVIREPSTKQSRGFGFVTYSKGSMADRSLRALPHLINGKQVDAKKAIPREDMPGYIDEPQPVNYYFFRPSPFDPSKIYIKGLSVERTATPDYYLVDELRRYFGQWGQVEQVEVSVNPRRLPYVIMDSPQSVLRCITHKKHEIAQRTVHCIRVSAGGGREAADSFTADLARLLGAANIHVSSGHNDNSVARGSPSKGGFPHSRSLGGSPTKGGSKHNSPQHELHVNTITPNNTTQQGDADNEVNGHADVVSGPPSTLTPASTNIQ